MTDPAPYPSSHTPPVAVETVAAGDMVLLGGHWAEVLAAGIDGPRVVLYVAGRILRYERGEQVQVFRPLRQQNANPAFYLTFGPIVLVSTLRERIAERVADWRRRAHQTGRS